MRPLLTILLLSSCASQVDAAFVTSSSGMSSPSIVNFSQFTASNTHIGGGATEVGSLVGESITFTSTSSTAIIGPTSAGLGGSTGNGMWSSTSSTNARGAFVELNATSGSITFKFNAGPVAQVGEFINYVPNAANHVTITALAADGTILETYDVNALAPISTPGATNGGEFVGISRATADISSFRISTTSTSAPSNIVLDDLTFSRAPGGVVAVPAPSGFVLALCGIGVWALRFRRRDS